MSHFVNFGLLFSFLTLAVSGILSFVQPFSITVTRIHIIFGIVTFLLIGVHLYAKIKYFKKQFKLKGKVVGTCALIWVLLLAASWENWWPVKKVIEQGYEARHNQEIVRPHALIGSLQEHRRITASRKIEESGKTALSVHVALTEQQSSFPAVVIWAESKNGTIVETIFMNESLAYSDKPTWFGKATPRHTILPVWRHRYTIISGVSPDGKIDAASGATQDHKFSLEAHLSADGEPFTIFLEINAHGDSDEKWKDQHLGQPSILYSVYIDPKEKQKYHLLELTGQGSEAIENGAINYDTDSLGSAKNILDLALVEIDVD